MNLIQAAQTMSSREIAELTGKEHKNVIRDIRAMLDALKGDGSDLSHVREDQDARGYTSAFHLDRELTETLLTGYSVPLRRKVIARWHELEAQAAAPAPAQVFQIPSTLPEALRLAAELEEQRAEAVAALAVAAPKAEALDRIATADGSLCLTDAAKELQLQPKVVIAWMSANKWIYKRAGSASWIGYQDRIQAGLLEHKNHIVLLADGTERIRDQVRVTAKGLARLAASIRAEAA